MPSDPAPATVSGASAPGRPGPRRPVFAERLWPSAGIWTATVAFGAALGLIVAPVDPRLAVAVAVLGVIGSILFLTLTTPVLEVTGQDFAAGRASIPLRFVSAVEVLGAEQMRRARGASLDARAYLCIRGWLSAGVIARLSDPDDPTPYWLISSRHPQALAAALDASRQQRPDQQ